MIEKIISKNKLSLGLFFPIESYNGAIPTMNNQITLAQKAEKIGFKALWFRDVPLYDLNFGDVGQMFDPWIYMTHIMNHTKNIHLATGSIVLPLRHPIHTAKSANSIQNLSGGRLILGLASGDRAVEYPAFNKDINSKSELFRDNFQFIKGLQNEFPSIQNNYYGTITGNVDLLPKSNYKIPMLITGHSGQSLEWIAEHGDGWIYYPRNFRMLETNLKNWEHNLKITNQPWKPFIQSLYIDLVAEVNAPPKPIHLGFQSGAQYLLKYLKTLENYGVNHVIINLKYGSRPVEEILDDIEKHVIEYF